MKPQTDLIPGIYNYCDTWCERCLFTGRCRSFQLQTDAGLAKTMSADTDLVQQLTDALNLTKQYIDKLSRAKDLSGANAPAEAQVQALEEQALAVPTIDFRRHQAVQLANEYLKQTALWIRDEKKLLEQVGYQQLQEVELGLRTQEEAMPMLNALKDAWEMIGWYRTLIPVKTQSALRALAEPTSDSHLNDYHLGKAKLVLVSIDRSLLAWQTLMQHFPEKTDDMLDLLALLARLRREMETLFPEARAFQRPGID